MNYHYNLLCVIASIFLICLLNSINCGSAVPANFQPTPANIDTNAFFFWYSLPYDYKYKLMDKFKTANTTSTSNSTISPTDATTTTTTTTTSNNSTLPSEFFVPGSFRYIPIWTAMYEDQLKGNCDFKSQIRLVLVALQEMDAEGLEKLYEIAPKMLTKVLNRIPDQLIVRVMTNLVRSGHEIVRMFKFLEIISDFDLSNEKVLKRIRKLAFDHDDADLMALTDEYPEYIIHSSLDHEELINSIRPNGQPQVFWDRLCANAVYGSSMKTKNYDDFMKFPMFSHKINTNGWSLAMFSIATGRYNIAAAMPLSLTYAPNSPVIPFVPGNHITRIEHLIPLIPDTDVKQFMLTRYKLPASLVRTNDPVYPTFRTIGENGNQIDVRVLPESEREQLSLIWPKFPIDIDDITDRMFSRDENVLETLYNEYY